ncbi:MAG: ferrous iron transport protein B [Clostridia bacterium]|nr:ferrous iron transport protein B [Clostridia bacterium]
MIIALAGNQNCGKTTLFNALTGSNQHVGNFPGVTVEQKIGSLKEGKKSNSDIKIVDLPGIYSLSPYTNEEIVSRDYIIREKPDGILNIVDASNIERNLYLSLQLAELGIPMVIALNMMDEVRENGGSIDIELMSKLLGVPVVPISAAKEDGIEELKSVFVKTFENKIKPQVVDFCNSDDQGGVHRAIHSIMHMIEDHAKDKNISRRFAATKVVEGDDTMIDFLKLSANEIETIEHTLIELTSEVGMDSQAAIADMRYRFIENVVSQTVIKQKESKQHKISVTIDKVLTHKYFGIPLFLAIMGLVFYLSFDLIGGNLTSVFEIAIDNMITTVREGLIQFEMNPVMISLICDGALSGIGSVLSFLPTILVLFLFLSLMEDSGYMARVAYVMDKALRKIGLSGKSFVPMLVGFGCSVPAVMATRTLSSERDKRMTIILIPFMSCTAKLPIYGYIASIMFPGISGLITLSLYVLGIVLAVVMALVLKKFVYKGKSVPFVMELPNYRIPGFKTTLLLLYDKAKDFIVKAFTIIFTASVVIWFFKTFDIRFNVVSDTEYSILANIAKFIAPIFNPLGFGSWKTTTALISGFMAKEAVVSILDVLTMGEGINGLFTTASAYAFLVFTSLYTPCVAAVAAIRNEFGSKRKGLLIAVLQSVYAWTVAFIIYRILLMFIV